MLSTRLERGYIGHFAWKGNNKLHRVESVFDRISASFSGRWVPAWVEKIRRRSDDKGCRLVWWPDVFNQANNIVDRNSPVRPVTHRLVAVIVFTVIGASACDRQLTDDQVVGTWRVPSGKSESGVPGVPVVDLSRTRLVFKADGSVIVEDLPTLVYGRTPERVTGTGTWTLRRVSDGLSVSLSVKNENRSGRNLLLGLGVHNSFGELYLYDTDDDFREFVKYKRVDQ